MKRTLGQDATYPTGQNTTNETRHEFRLVCNDILRVVLGTQRLHRLWLYLEHRFLCLKWPAHRGEKGPAKRNQNGLNATTDDLDPAGNSDQLVKKRDR